MQPDFNFSLASESEAQSFLELVRRLVDSDGASIWGRTRQSGATVNLGLSPSHGALQNGEIYLAGVDGGPRVKMGIAELGMQCLQRDQGTGYHQPYGALIVYGKGLKPSDTRRQIDLTDVRPEILHLLSVPNETAPLTALP